MKKIFSLVIVFFIALLGYSQSTLYLRGDTIRAFKQGDSSFTKVDSFLIVTKQAFIGKNYTWQPSTSLHLGDTTRAIRINKMYSRSNVVAPVNGMMIYEDSTSSFLCFAGGVWGSCASGVGTGTVTSISQGYGIINTPNPIVATGTVTVDTATLSGKYVRLADSTGTGYATQYDLTQIGGGGIWGTITGTLSDQTDLQAALDGKQPLDADLTTIAGLTATTDNFIQSKAGAWASRTIAQVKTDLGLTGTNSGDQTITLTDDVTGSGIGSFATTIADNSVDGTDIALGTDAAGDLMMYNGTDWIRVAIGTNGQLLRVNTGATAVEYFTPSYITTRDRFGKSGEDESDNVNRIYNSSETGDFTFLVRQFHAFANHSNGYAQFFGLKPDATTSKIILTNNDNTSAEAGFTSIFSDVTDTIAEFTVFAYESTPTFNKGNANYGSFIRWKNRTILISPNPVAGYLKIANLYTTVDTTNFKPLVRHITDTTVFQMTYWPGGGGYTDEQAQDAVGAMINSTLQYVDATPLLGINLGNANTWTADQSVPDEAYDATAWNGSVELPTKNAIRDKFESLSAIDETFANANLTFTANRTHNASSFWLKVQSLQELELTSGGTPNTFGLKDLKGEKGLQIFGNFSATVGADVFAAGGSTGLPIAGMDAFDGGGSNYLYLKPASLEIFTISNDDTETKLLTWNSTDKKVEYRLVSSLGGAGTIEAGLTNEMAFYTGAGTTVNGASDFLYDAANSGFRLYKAGADGFIVYNLTGRLSFYDIDNTKDRFIINADGGFQAGANAFSSPMLWVKTAGVQIGENSMGDITGQLSVIVTSTTRVGIKLNLAASQTANAFEINDNAGSGLLRISKDGYITAAAATYSAGGFDALVRNQTSGRWELTTIPGIDEGPANLITNTTDVGNVGTGVDDLITYSIEAGKLAADGDYLEFTMTFDFAANANNKQITVVYGGTTIYASGAGAQNDGSMEIKGTIIRTGAATQRITFSQINNGTIFTDYADYITATETLSGAVVLKATGEGTSNDDLIQKILIVKYFPVN